MSKQEENLYSSPNVQRFLKKAESVRMTRHEKRLVFNAVTRKINLLESTRKTTKGDVFMKVAESVAGMWHIKGINQHAVASMWQTVSHYSKRTVAAAVVFMVALASFGTTYAAENALPGDVLYGVKINVNEEVKSFVAVGDNAKAKVAVSLAKKRLEEAEVLSATGKLNANTQSIIETNFKKHTETIKEKVDSLKEQKNNDAVDDVITDLASGIKAHESILTSIKGSTDKNTGEQIDQLIGSVNTQVTQQILPSISTTEATDTPAVMPVLVTSTSTVKTDDSDTKSNTTETSSTSPTTKNDNAKESTSTSETSSSTEAVKEAVMLDFAPDTKSLKVNVGSALSAKLQAEATTSTSSSNTNVNLILDAISNNNASSSKTPNTTSASDSAKNKQVISEATKVITTKTTISAKSNVSQGEVDVKQKAVINIVNDVKTATNNASKDGDESLLTQKANQKLTQAQDKINEAKALLDKKQYKEALDAFAQAKSLALEAQTFAQVHTDAPSEVINLLKAK